MSTQTNDPPTDAEAAARAALAELIAKHGLPEPAAINWYSYGFGTLVRAHLGLTTHTREHVAGWADVMHRKVKTEQKIRETEYDPNRWWCIWDTSVMLRNWRPGVLLIVNHGETRYAKTAAAEQAERDELIERAMFYRTPAVAR